MKNPSIEWLHSKLDKHIKLAAVYTEIPELDFIIRTCRLKPYEYLFEERSSKIVLYKWWIDEFGNSLFINKRKGIDIVTGDLKIDLDRIVSTDLYYGLSLERVLKMGKFLHFTIGKDEDLLQECSALTCLGIDDHLRSYLYWYGEWQQVSPLIFGLEALKVVANNSDIKYYRQLENKKNCGVPCVGNSTWISYLPASAAFIADLNKRSEMMASLLKP